MKPRTIENLQYFVGKVCSIVSTSMNRAFDERISREHFVVLIRDIDSDGIWGTHPYNPALVSFFSLEHIISVHEEQVIDPDNPEHAEMIKEYEQKTGKKVQGDLKNSPQPIPSQENSQLLNIIQEESPAQSEEGDSTFIDIDSLERLAGECQRAFHIQDNPISPSMLNQFRSGKP